MNFLKTAAVTVFFLILVPVMAQMPDWKFHRDREGNGYYFDRANKIHVLDVKTEEYRPVSESEIPYFYNLSVELIRSYHANDAVYYLKSINSIKSENIRIMKIQQNSVKQLKKLSSNNGERYDIMDRENCVLINRKGAKFTVTNDHVKYRFNMEERPFLLKKRWKYYGTSHSVKFGVTGVTDGAFDYLVGIESRIYRFRLTDIDTAILSWQRELGKDAFKRKEIDKGESFVINSFRYGDGSPFSGIEGYFIRGRRFVYIRTLCHDNLAGSVMEKMKMVVESFQMY